MKKSMTVGAFSLLAFTLIGLSVGLLYLFKKCFTILLGRTKKTDDFSGLK